MNEFDFTVSVTFFIIVLNVVVFVMTSYGYPQLIEQGYLKPYRIIRKNTWYELVTSGFLHAGFAHLFVNMLTLYFFGTIMERILGPAFYGGLYLTGLVVSGIPSVIKFRNSPDYATLGASGAVGAVLFAFIFLFPMESLYLLFLPVPIPAFLFAVCYLIYSMYESKQARGKINHEAHMAGAIWGLLYMALFVPNALNHALGVFGFL